MEKSLPLAAMSSGEQAQFPVKWSKEAPSEASLAGISLTMPNTRPRRQAAVKTMQRVKTWVKDDAV